MPRPNLLFLLTDQQRDDSVGMVQDGRAVCPALDAFAASGTRFDACYTTCPLCVPARTSLFTGTYPTRNGVLTNDHAAARSPATPLHRLLADAGYRLGHIGRDEVRVEPPLPQIAPFSPWLGPKDHSAWLQAAGRSVVFDVGPLYRAVLDRVGDALVEKKYSAPRTAVWPGAAGDFLDRWYGDRAAEALTNAAAGDAPFALFVNLHAPHPPMVVPEPYASRFAPERITLPTNVGRPAAGEPPGRRQGVAARLAEGVDEAQWRRVWATHLGLCALADDALATVLDRLHALGLDSKTVVVATSDHGEQLGQHAMFQKMEMYEPAVRVPLSIRAPGRPAGLRHQRPVSHLDLLPTLCDLLDLQRPADLDGQSLAPCLTGAAPPQRPVFSQYSGNSGAGALRRMIVADGWKLVHAPGEGDELYDLASDPLEMDNRAADPGQSARLAALRAIARDWHQALGDRCPW